MISTFNAVVAYARSNSGTWYQGTNAYQGAYADEKPRVGVLMFSSLRSGIAWQDMAVKNVSLYLDYGTAGAARQKTIGLYATSRNSIGGEGIDMLGANFGQFYTSVSTYGNEETVVFNETTNAAMFAKMAQWIENGATNGIALYVNETTTGSNSYSTNFLNVTAATITIEYEVKGSKGILNPTSVNVGAAVTLTIEPIESEYVVSHAVEWKLGNATSGVISLAGGVNEYTFTIPYSWMEQMPGETSAAGVCVLTTYENGVKKATRQIAFEVTIPQSFAPVINSFSVQRYAGVIGDSGETVYEASLSGANVWVNCDVSIDTAGGNNAGSAYIRYYPANDEAGAQETAIAWNGNRISLSNDMAVVPGTFALGNAYVFELHVTNGHYSVVKTARVEKSWAPFHIAGTGYGIGFGMYSDGTEEVPKIQTAWPIYDAQGKKIGAEDDTGWVDLGLASGISAGTNTLGNYVGVAYRKIGKRVIVAANVALSWKSSVRINGTLLPESIRPQRSVYAVCPTGGRYVIRAYANPEGAVHIEWAQNLASSSSTSNATLSWTDIWLEYFVD